MVSTPPSVVVIVIVVLVLVLPSPSSLSYSSLSSCRCCHRCPHPSVADGSAREGERVLDLSVPSSWLTDLSAWGTKRWWDPRGGGRGHWIYPSHCRRWLIRARWGWSGGRIRMGGEGGAGPVPPSPLPTGSHSPPLAVIAWDNRHHRSHPRPLSPLPERAAIVRAHCCRRSPRLPLSRGSVDGKERGEE